MKFNFTHFLINKAVAKNQGVDEQAANRLAILGGLGSLGLSQSVILTQTLSRRQAESQTSSTSPPVTSRLEKVDTPNVVRKTLVDAEEVVNEAELIFQKEFMEPTASTSVWAQSPLPDESVNKGSNVTAYTLEEGWVVVPDFSALSEEVGSEDFSSRCEQVAVFTKLKLSFLVNFRDCTKIYGESLGSDNFEEITRVMQHSTVRFSESIPAAGSIVQEDSSVFLVVNLPDSVCPEE